jgi:hypothetical protein
MMRWVHSPANWSGLVLAIAVLALKSLGLLGGGVGLAALAYAVGFAVAGLWVGWPWSEANPDAVLTFTDQGDARTAMDEALRGVRDWVERNPGQRLQPAVQAQVLALCQSLEALLQQWESSRGSLSLQESFHARHIAISYLPEALRTYLSIPLAFAGTRRLENGRTAQDTLAHTLSQLQDQVQRLSDDLARQDAEAFLSHSRFLSEKFATPSLGLGVPSSSSPPGDSSTP